MKIARRTTMTLFAALAMAACSDDRSANNADTDQALDAQRTGGQMSGTGGMSDRQDMQGTGRNAMTEQMQAHLRMMEGANGDSLQAMMPMHRQLVGNMITQFNTDRRGTNMSDNAATTATVDSLQQDLTRMQGMSAAELQRMMPAHEARLRRLMDAHGMMVGATMR